MTHYLTANACKVSSGVKREHLDSPGGSGRVHLRHATSERGGTASGVVGHGAPSDRSAQRRREALRPLRERMPVLYALYPLVTPGAHASFIPELLRDRWGVGPEFCRLLHGRAARGSKAIAALVETDKRRCANVRHGFAFQSLLQQLPRQCANRLLQEEKAAASMLSAGQKDGKGEQRLSLMHLDALLFLREFLQVPPLGQLGEHGTGRRQTDHPGPLCSEQAKRESPIGRVLEVPAERASRHNIQ